MGGDLCKSLHWEYVNRCVIEDIREWESGGEGYFATVWQDLNSHGQRMGAAIRDCGFWGGLEDTAEMYHASS